MDIAIVGAGLAGLTAAYDLVRSGNNVALYDAGAEAGGQVRTRRERGFVIEEGAEGFVAADSAVPDLCRELGLADQVIQQVERRSLLYRGGALSPMSSNEAATVLGIPVPDESSPRGLCTLREGMGALTAALLGAIRGRGEVRLLTAVTRIDRHDRQWRLSLSDATTATARSVVLAVPPDAAATLIEPLDAEAASLLRTMVLNSTLSVSLAYQRREVAHDLAASGLVVTPGENSARGLRACVFCSSKFAHRAPADAVLLRAFFRPDPTELGASDADWVSRATAVLGPILGIAPWPSDSWVSRWPDAIPQPGTEHANRLSRLELRMTQLGSVRLAGSAYHQGGIPGAVRSGRHVGRLIARPLPV